MTHDITGDAELKQRVRALTGYEDNPDELPDKQLEEIIQTVKLKLDVEFSSTSWYSDKGYSLVLLGTACIYCKSQLENHSVSGWSIGDESIDVRETDPDESLQYQMFNELVQDGVDASTVISTTGQTLRNTSGYIG